MKVNIITGLLFFWSIAADPISKAVSSVKTGVMIYDFFKKISKGYHDRKLKFVNQWVNEGYVYIDCKINDTGAMAHFLIQTEFGPNIANKVLDACYNDYTLNKLLDQIKHQAEIEGKSNWNIHAYGVNAGIKRFKTKCKRGGSVNDCENWVDWYVDMTNAENRVWNQSELQKRNDNAEREARKCQGYCND